MTFLANIPDYYVFAAIRVNLEEFCSYRRARRGSISDCSDTESVTSEWRPKAKESITSANHLFISEAPSDMGVSRLVNGDANISRPHIRLSRKDASTSCRVLTRDVGVHHAARVRSVGLMADLLPAPENDIENYFSGKRASVASSATGDPERGNAKAKLLNELGKSNSGIISRLSSEVGKDVPPPLMFDNSTNTEQALTRQQGSMTDSVRTRDQKTTTVLSAQDVVSRTDMEREMQIKMKERIETVREEWQREVEEKISREKRDWEMKGKMKVREEVEKRRRDWEKEMEERISREKKEWESKVRMRIREQISKERKEWDIEVEEKMEREKRMWQRQMEDSVSERTKKSYEEDLLQAVAEGVRKERREWELEADEKVAEARKEWEEEMKLRIDQENQKTNREHLKDLEHLKQDYERNYELLQRENEAKLKETIEHEIQQVSRRNERQLELTQQEWEKNFNEKLHDELKRAKESQERKTRELEDKHNEDLSRARKAWEASQAIKPLTRHREVQVGIKEEVPPCQKCSVPKRTIGVSWDKVTDSNWESKGREQKLKPISKSCYIQTEANKVRIAACQTDEQVRDTRSVGTSTAMMLALKKEDHISISTAAASPAITPEQERRPFGSSGVNICDKCDATITSVAKDFVGAPSPSDAPVISMPLPPSSANSKIPRLLDPFKLEPKLETPPQNSANKFNRDSDLRRSDSRIDKLVASRTEEKSARSVVEPRLSDQTPDLLSDPKHTQRRRDSGPLPHTEGEEKSKVPFLRQQTYTKMETEEQDGSPTRRKMSSVHEDEEEGALAGAPKLLPVPSRPLTSTFRRERSSPEIGSKDSTSVWEKEMMAFVKPKEEASR